MKNTRTIFLVVVVVLIVGSIYVLESRKTAPTGTTTEVDEIRIEDELVAREEDVGKEDETLDGAASGTETALAPEEDPEPQQEERAPLTPTRADIIAQKAAKYERAKEVSTPDHFINTEAFELRDLIGEKVILVDFWTYSCINCQRTTPYLNSWHDKYADDGLVIVGIHTPEFEFEKEIDNVEKATAGLGIEYPVVMDNDYSTWGAYKNRYWPRKYLIDIDGFIVYDHIGEGAYEATEKKIVEAINEKNRYEGKTEIAIDTRTPEEIDEVDFSQIRTRESYFGSKRVEYLMNNPGQSCYGKSCEFSRPEEILPNLFALEGEWRIEQENAVLLSDEGAIHSNFHASKVNLVVGAKGAVEAEVYLDGELVTNEFAGADVVNGIVTFEEHTLYNLIDLKGDYSTHTLEVRFLDEGASVFAFTFG